MEYIFEDNFMKICIYLINSSNYSQRGKAKTNRKKLLKIPKRHLKNAFLCKLLNCLFLAD